MKNKFVYLVTIVLVVSFRIASIEFWQISLARDFIGVPLNVSTPEAAIPIISPQLLEGKFHEGLDVIFHHPSLF